MRRKCFSQAYENDATEDQDDNLGVRAGRVMEVDVVESDAALNAVRRDDATWRDDASWSNFNSNCTMLEKGLALTMVEIE